MGIFDYFRLKREERRKERLLEERERLIKERVLLQTHEKQRLGIFDRLINQFYKFLFFFWSKREERISKEKERMSEKKERLIKEKLLFYKKDIFENNDIIDYISGGTYKDEIDYNLNIYARLVKLLMGRDINLCKRNIDTIIKIIVSRNYTIERFGKEIGTKIIKEKTFKGMSEEMFKDHLRLLISEGYPSQFILGNHPSTGEKAIMRTELTLKNGTKKVIYKPTIDDKIGFSGESEYTFLDDKLV
tara:strand:+ start:3049 stop:3786 length:738 start_codon:yes stop_codon:yes gene_type:complete